MSKAELEAIAEALGLNTSYHQNQDRMNACANNSGPQWRPITEITEKAYMAAKKLARNWDQEELPLEGEGI